MNYENRGHSASGEDVVEPQNIGVSEVNITPEDPSAEIVDPEHRSLEQQHLLDARAAHESARSKLQEATKEVLSLWIKYHGTFLFLDNEDINHFPNNYSRQLEVLDERIVGEGGVAARSGEASQESTGGMFGLLRNTFERGKKMLSADASGSVEESVVIAQLKKEQEALVNEYNTIQTAFSIARKKLDAAITNYARLSNNTSDSVASQLDPSLRFENQVKYDIQPLYKNTYTMVDLRGFLQANNIPVPPEVEEFEILAAK